MDDLEGMLARTPRLIPAVTDKEDDGSLQARSLKGLSEPAVNTYVAEFLPPCCICGKDASGYHYGAHTCEACKAFFRRYLLRTMTYKCGNDRNCTIAPTVGPPCSYCRLQKCLAAGMSKDAVKTGRYTLTWKNNNIRRVKNLQDGTLDKEQAGNKQEQTTSEIFWTSPVTDLDIFVQVLRDHHKKSLLVMRPRPEALQLFLENKRLHESVFGELKPVSRDVYMEIFQATGMDVDGRREFLATFLNHIESATKKFIHFARGIPGFSTLPTTDQMSLIRSGRLNTWMFWAYSGFQLDYGVAFGFDEVTIELNYLRNISYCKELMDRRLQVIKRLQCLELTYDESVLLGCVSLMNSDEGLSSPSQVEEIQSKLLEAFAYLLNKSHPHKPSLILAQCLSILVEVRHVDNLAVEEESKVRIDWSDKLEIPPLFYGVWDYQQ